MINTRDEILFIFANILDSSNEQGPDLSRFPNALKVLEEEGLETKPPKTENPINAPEDNGSKTGSPEWAAANYPYAYLFGHAPFLGYISDRKNDPITKNLMENLVTNHPEKYFEWGLRRLEAKALDRLGADWGLRAAEQLVKTNPHYAMVLGTIFKDKKYINNPTLLPELWDNMIKQETDRSMKTSSGRMFPGMLFGRMKSLMNILKEHHPEFYKNNIEDTAIENKFSGPDRLPAPHTKSISNRENWPWGEPEPGTSEWLVENYPHTYLRGQDLAGSGYIREFQNPAAVKALMDKLVREDPIKYFEWNLRRVGDKGGNVNLKDWQRPAIESLIEKNPYEALMFKDKIFGVRGTEDFLPKLWEKLISLGASRNKKGLQEFPEQVYRNMLSLAGLIAVTDPEFYKSKIKNSMFSTKEFDDRAKQMTE